MAAVKYDYPSLKRQFIATPDLSIRELCRRNSIPENSRMAVQRRATDEDWKGERQKALDLSTERVIDAVADAEARRALRLAQVENNAVDMADEMIDQVRGRLKKLHPVMGTDDDGKEAVVDYRPDLLVRPEDLGKIFKGVGEMRASVRPAELPSASKGANSGGGSGLNVSLPEGTELAIVARYVDRVRSEGGPVPDFDTPAEGDATGAALQSGAPGAGEGAIQP